VKQLGHPPRDGPPSVVSQQQLYSVRHSGLDPESRLPGLESRFRGNDNVVMCACKAIIGTPPWQAEKKWVAQGAKPRSLP
jgi:hypothetical protein